MAVELIKVPDLGGAESVEVIELSVSVGDRIDVEESIVVLETDKASMDVPSPVAGKVVSILVQEGATLNEGDALMEVELGGVVESTDTAMESDSEPVNESVVDESVDNVAVGSEQAEKVETTATPSGDSDAKSEMIIVVPDVGTEQAVEIIEVLVSKGSQLAEGDTILVLETDKATVEMPSPADGELLALTVKEGDKIKMGDRIGSIMTVAPSLDAVANKPDALSRNSSELIEISDKNITEKPVSLAVSTQASGSAEKNNQQAEASYSDVYAGPAVRQMARKLGVNLGLVTASGPRSRILKEDVELFVKSSLTDPAGSVVSGAGILSVPAIDFSKFGNVETIPLSKIQKLTAANMLRNWLNVPHVTQFDDADVSDMDDFRKSLKAEGEKRGVKLTPMAFLVKACAKALCENPEFNRSISADGESFIQKNYVNIGIAVDTPRGLMVPVLKNADKKGLWELAAEVTELATKARDGKLTLAEMQGGCFTISSLGALGGTGFTPIVSAPEVAILGVSKSQIKPIWDGSDFVPRTMLPLSVSYDHRAINGADCGRFFTCLVALLSDVRRLSL